jgi:hypothetical protein
VYVTSGHQILVFDGAHAPSPTLVRTIGGPTTMLELPERIVFSP